MKGEKKNKKGGGVGGGGGRGEIMLEKLDEKVSSAMSGPTYTLCGVYK